jgi:integrase
MSVTLRTQRDGKTLRPYWYGEYKDSEGKRKVINLNVKWTGTPPASGRVGDKGDDSFEVSRKKAEESLKSFQDDAKRKGRADTLTERLIESKTGRKVRYVRIDELSQGWRRVPRKAKPTEAHLSNCDAHFARFVAFMAGHAPGKTYLYEVTAPDPSADIDKSDAGRFVEMLRANLSPATAQYGVRLLNRAFTIMLPDGVKSPFHGFVGQRGTASSDVVNRKPFTPDELRALLDAARDDSFMFPLIVCAAMTGMRRGDVCKLQWSDVDMPGGMLNVKTSKSGKRTTVSIPIFPVLRHVLANAGEKKSGYVWPDAARLLKDNPHALSRRFKNIVAVALGGYEPDTEPEPESLADILDEVIATICENVPEGTRRARMIDVMRRYAEGQGVRRIQKEIGVSRATISTDLNTVEGWSGKRFNRRGAGRHSKQSIGASVATLTRIQRTQGQKAASIYDFHALRTTWITLALAAGVQMEIVRRVTGHATVDVVLNHYFKPDREQFRAALSGALPDVLTGNGHGKPKRLTAGDELAGLVAKIQDGTATAADKKRLRLLAAKV